MSRLVKWGVAAVLVVVTMVYLSSRVGEQPMAKREQPVNIDELAK
jgi:hypothetical protein